MTAYKVSLPSSLDYGLGHILDRWGGLTASGLPICAKYLPHIPASNLKPKSLSARQGLRFESKVTNALIRGDFTENLCNTFNLNPVLFQFQILHNPSFKYLNQNDTKSKFCIPDILILVKSISPVEPISSIFSPLSSISLKESVLFLPNTSLDSISLTPSQFYFIICIEVKLTWTEIAFEKLQNLYLPVIQKAFFSPVLPLVIVKNLRPNSPKPQSILSHALTLDSPLLHYLGVGSIF
jgi:hypothetical protein